MTELVRSAATKLDISVQNAVGGLVNQPKIGFYYINEHVVNMEAIIARNSDQIDVALRQMNGSLKDI